SGVIAHHRKKSIDWKTVKILAIGSLPTSLITVWILSLFFSDANDYQSLITSSLGVMLILTSLVLIFKKQLIAWVGKRGGSLFTQRSTTTYTLVIGIIMGALVTLSSVGAGAICTAALLVLYPTFSSVRVVGTDLAHAVPLTLIGGLGHLMLGNVDFVLLGALLVGSIPAIHLGTHSAARMPDQWLRPMLASALLGLGIKYALF
ncbi:MAG: sulfite exporter TauE/SafE family protein, partial [Gammaproteobacteria bacterium]